MSQRYSSVSHENGASASATCSSTNGCGVTGASNRVAATPKLAFGIADTVIRAVYRIEGWETYDMAL